MQALGLAVIVIGLGMALSVKDLIPSVACLLLGALTGELMKIERGIEMIGQNLENRFSSGRSTFVQGFVTMAVQRTLIVLKATPLRTGLSEGKRESELLWRI